MLTVSEGGRQNSDVHQGTRLRAALFPSGPGGANENRPTSLSNSGPSSPCPARRVAGVTSGQCSPLLKKRGPFSLLNLTPRSPDSTRLKLSGLLTTQYPSVPKVLRPGSAKQPRVALHGPGHTYPSVTNPLRSRESERSADFCL